MILLSPVETTRWPPHLWGEDIVHALVKTRGKQNKARVAEAARGLIQFEKRGSA